MSDPAAAFRDAIAAGAYAEARARLAGIRTALEAEPGEERARDTGELLEWARRMVLAGRAHAASELRGLRRPFRRQAPVPRRGAIRLLG